MLDAAVEAVEGDIVAGDVASPAPVGPAAADESQADVVAMAAAAPLDEAAGPADAVLGRRGRALVTYHVPGGSISYYQSKNAFEAVCDHPHHGRCVVTRTAKARVGGSGPGGRGGRPVGFLAAWLRAGEALPDKASHWNRECMDRPWAERQALREQIGQTAAGLVLLNCERPLAEGEPAEAHDLDAYLPTR